MLCEPNMLLVVIVPLVKFLYEKTDCFNDACRLLCGGKGTETVC
jgi:hypothetical protein